MKSWPLVGLDEIFEIARGGSPRPIDAYITDDPDGINWISISDATESQKYITKTKKRIRKEGASRSRAVKPGDFLLSNSMSFGKPYIMGTHGCIHDGWLVLTPRRKDVDSDFFYHLLGSQTVYREFERRAAGATVKNLNIDLVKTVKILFPPVEEQQRIAAILDRAEAMRSKRRQALAQLDTLSQSLFFEMFGDPRTNPKGLATSTIGKLLTLKSGNFLPASKMTAAGVYPVYGGNGINGWHDKYMFEQPVISIGRVGAYCGVVHLTEPKSWVTDNSLLVAGLDSAVSQGYLFEALKIANLNQYASQSGQPLISASRLSDVRLLIPSMDYQLRFEGLVAGVTKINAQVESSLGFIDDLFSSLQERAFTGEL